jgi:tetratricopeptide (TPR) repeat protein
VLVLEDLHWSDSSTVDAMLRAHPLRRTVQELCGRGQALELALEFLPAADVAAYNEGHGGSRGGTGLQPGPLALPTAWSNTPPLRGALRPDDVSCHPGAVRPGSYLRPAALGSGALPARSRPGVRGAYGGGGCRLYRGDLIAARTHFEQSLERSAAQRPSTSIFAGGLYPGIANLVWLARALWVLGYADQAQQRSQDALALARQTEHAPSIAYAEYMLAMLSQCLRETAATHARADALMTFASAQGLIHRAGQGRILLGWAVAMEGDAAAGVHHIQQGLAVHQDMGIKMGQPYYLSLLAEAFCQAARPEAGLTVLAEALTLLATTEERWWEAEVSRLMGALQLQLPSPDVPQAEACFQKALDVARRQQAKALELRATMSLSRLWQRQGKREAAWQLLAEVYGWFTEGFATPDLQEAKALLEELSSQ